MALEVTRQSFDAMTPAEQSQVIAEGARIIDPGAGERQERRELIANEMARERRARTIKRSAFDKMGNAERDAFIASGGLLAD